MFNFFNIAVIVIKRFITFINLFKLVFITKDKCYKVGFLYNIV